MKLSALAGFAAGLVLAVWLLSKYGAAAILALVAHAGWGLVPAMLFHIVQIVASALAWQKTVGPTRPAPTLRAYVVLRWIREGVNNLLPVAQVGGVVVTVRLLWQAGVPLVEAVAGTIGDLTLEVLTQLAFTLLGLGLLISLVGSGGVARIVLGGLAAALPVAVGLVAAQKFGLGRLLELAVARFGSATGWRGMPDMVGLHHLMTALYRSPSRLLQGLLWHAITWLLGGLEICLFMHVLGHGIGIGPGLVIESLSQAVKAAGFAVPGALGVQEGGFILVGGLFHISPELAVALSLTKRLREVVLSLPSLLAWHQQEARHRLAKAVAPKTAAQ